MPAIKLTVNVEVDDVPVTGFPLVRRVEFPEMQSVVALRATGGGAVALPSGELTTIQCAVVQADKSVTYTFGGPVVLSPNGILILFDTTQTTVSVTNASGSTATVRGLLAGA